ncbi:MAG: agmatine deiminase family protein [Planctomycetota bacterium]|jgi:agmatine/peptidylarginine deiminase
MPEGWATFLPLLIFCGGVAWAAGLSDLSGFTVSRAAARGLQAPSVSNAFSVAERSAISGPGGKAAAPVSAVADFSPLAALAIAAGELATRHEEVFIGIARALAGRTPVVAFIRDEQQHALCRKLLADNGIDGSGIHFLRYPLDSMCVRDFGPLFVRRSDRSLSIVDASYSTGAGRDDECPVVLAGALGLPLSSMPLRLQGGNFLTNGDGIILTSTVVGGQGDGLGEITGHFKQYLGRSRWMRLEPLVGDVSERVDMFVTILAPDLAVVADANLGVDASNAGRLDDAAAALGRLDTSTGPMEVHRLPLPPRSSEGLVRSYNNITIVNDVVLVPTFSGVNPALERKALSVYEALLPGKAIVPIPSDSMIKEGFFLRGVTFGIPRGVDWERLYRQKRPGKRPA